MTDRLEDWKLGHPDWIHICDLQDELGGKVVERYFVPVLKPEPTPLYDLLKREREMAES